jgi:Holliday junction resolvase
VSESKLQSKILAWLKANKFWVFKTILCNRNGIPDIVGCTPQGNFFAIEVKFGSGKPSKLQEWNIQEIKKAGGIAFLAWDLETVKTTLAPELK